MSQNTYYFNVFNDYNDYNNDIVLKFAVPSDVKSISKKYCLFNKKNFK
jgi:hypothetical protein